MTKIETSVGWQGSEPFYAHLHELWTHETQCKWKFNETTSLPEQLKALEDWYEGLESLFSRIAGFISEEEEKQIVELCEIIDKKTQGDNFISVHLTVNDIIEIRKTLKKISYQLFKLQAKYKMLLPTTNKRIYDDLQEEIDAENS